MSAEPTKAAPARRATGVPHIPGNPRHLDTTAHEMADLRLTVEGERGRITVVLRSGVKVTGHPRSGAGSDPGEATLGLRTGNTWAEIAWSEIAAVMSPDGTLP